MRAMVGTWQKPSTELCWTRPGRPSFLMWCLVPRSVRCGAKQQTGRTRERRRKTEKSRSLLCYGCDGAASNKIEKEEAMCWKTTRQRYLDEIFVGTSLVAVGCEAKDLCSVCLWSVAPRHRRASEEDDGLVGELLAQTTFAAMRVHGGTWSSAGHVRKRPDSDDVCRSLSSCFGACFGRRR